MTVARPLLGLAGILMIVACGPKTADAAGNGQGASHLNTIDAAESAPAPIPTALAAAPAAPAALGQDEPTIDRTNQTGAAVLRTIFLKAGQIDGQRITDFQLIGRCQTAFTAAGKKTTIDWSKVGNFAGRDEAGRTVLDIDDGAGSHAISVPSGDQPEPLGNAAGRVDGGLSVIADSCAK